MADYYANKGPAPVAVVATGSTAADAAALTGGVLNVVSAADATKGVLLPVAVAGDTLRVYSSAATNALKVWPRTGGEVNNGTADAAFSATARKPVLLECLDGTNWIATLGS